MSIKDLELILKIIKSDNSQNQKRGEMYSFFRDGFQMIGLYVKV